MAKETQHPSFLRTSQAAAEQEEGGEIAGLSRPAVQAFPPPSLPPSPLGFARQRSVAFGQRTVQRTPTPTNPDYRSRNELARMTVREFDAYARSQADWHVSDQLDDSQRDGLRQILGFVRQGYVEACSDLHVWRMLNAMQQFGDSEYLSQVEHYAQAVANNEPIPFQPSSDSFLVYRMGKDLGLLKAVFPAWVLRTALDEYQFMQLRKGTSLISDVISYFQTSRPQPVFQAENGSDFESYRLLKKADHDEPANYHGGSLGGKIRNFHRFTRNSLRRLQTNYGDSSKSKPLTLILHTGMDHNGAFHRDPNLDAVIMDNAMLTLMLEGFESLGAMQSQIQPLAQQYGQNNQVDQVMIAGHGNASSMQLAGTIEENPDTHRIRENNDRLGAPLDLNTVSLPPGTTPEQQQEAQERVNRRAAATEALFEEILNNMDMNPANPGHRRVLLNACLTGSNAVRQALNAGDVPTAQQEVHTYIQNNPSLMNMAQGQADVHQAGAVTVLGANASFGSEATLVDPATHALDLSSTEDPQLTGTKLQYVEHGNEPTGALRAVLESWATDQASCFDAMRRKIAAVSGSTVWEQVIIRTCYQIILDRYQDNGEMIRQVGNHGGDLGHIHPWLNINRRNFAGFDDFGADAIEMLTAVQSSTDWAGDDKIPLSLFHAWMSLDAGNASLKDRFMAHLDTRFTVRTAREVVDVAYLDSKGHLAPLLAGGNDGAKLKLALIGVVGTTVNSACRTYLQGLVDPATQRFPAALNLSAALGGASGENQVLTAIGLGAQAPAPANPSANLRLEGESQNTVHVEPLTDERIAITGPGMEVPVYTRPDRGSTQAGTIPNAGRIQVIGETNGWLAIEFLYANPARQGTAFIQAANTL